MKREVPEGVRVTRVGWGCQQTGPGSERCEDCDLRNAGLAMRIYSHS